MASCYLKDSEMRYRNVKTLEEKEWLKLAVASFAKDWENEKDSIYDNWRERYHLPEM